MRYRFFCSTMLSSFATIFVMSTITPHLWFDTEAKEATKFYTSLFSNSKINSVTTLHDTPSGDCDILSFELRGLPFMAMSAGPLFKFNPSISFMVNFDPSKEKNARENIDVVWAKLSEGGKALMPLQEYPFSKRYGWIQDRYGLSWQLIYTDPEGEDRPVIVPSLLFVGDVYGKADDAIKFYLSLFKGSKMGAMKRYGPGQEPDKEGAVMYADFKIRDSWFAGMDSAHEHKFAFNEAISFIVNCHDQQKSTIIWKNFQQYPSPNNADG